MRTPTFGLSRAAGARVGVRFAHPNLLVFAALACLATASSAQVLDLPTRPGVTQQVLVEAAPSTKAVAILFAGGHGGVRFTDGQPASLRGNFLLRTRALWHAQGIATATFGVPSDHARQPFLDDPFRLSDDHATDVGVVVAALRKRFDAPVWLVGTSRGTLSAASVGLKLGQKAAPVRPDGVVLTASMTSIAELPIDSFALPALLVAHRNDRCGATDYRDVPRITSRLRAPRHELLWFSGGRSEGPWCEAFAYHGFNGIEDDVVAAIARWMLH